MGFEGDISAAEVAPPAAAAKGAGPALDRWLVPLMVGFAPVLLLLWSWAPSGAWTQAQVAIRAYSVPVVAAELLVIGLALRQGLLSALRAIAWPRLVPAAACLLLAIMLATAVFAPDPARALTFTGYWIVHILFGLSVWRLCGTGLRPADLIGAYLAGFVLFVACFALFVGQVAQPERFDWTRGLPAGTHIRHLGYYAAAIFGLSAGLMATAKGRRAWGAAFAVATLAAGLAFWTGSRGTIAAALAGLIVGVVLLPLARRLRCWAGALGALGLGALVTTWLPSPAANMGFARTLEASAGDNIATGRTVMWRLVLEAIGDRPLFGYGENQMHFVATFSTMKQPHNLLLQILLAWGAIGALCVLVLAAAYARRALPVVRADRGELAAPVMAMATLFAFSLFDGALYYALPISLFAACAALVACRFSPPVSR